MALKRQIDLQSFVSFILGGALFIFLLSTGYLSYQGVYRSILQGFAGKLRAISTTVASFIDGDEHERVRMGGSEEDEGYQALTKRLRAVMGRAGLTYHYSLILPKQNTLAYVLDGTEGDTHSTLGTEEEVPTDEWERLHAVLQTGIPSESEIRQFELWGQLKVGNAPIYGSHENVIGLVGADVNISVIDQKARLALLQVLGLIVATLLVSGWIALRIAKQLSRPIGALKTSILEMAAGDYSTPITLDGPNELRALARVFEEARQCLLEAEKNCSEKLAEAEEARKIQSLASLLEEEKREISGSAFLRIFASRKEGIDLSGIVEHESRGICWIGFTPTSQVAALWKRSAIQTICKGLLSRTSCDLDELGLHLERLFSEDVLFFVLYDRSHNQVRTLKRSREASIYSIGWEAENVPAAITPNAPETSVFTSSELLTRIGFVADDVHPFAREPAVLMFLGEDLREQEVLLVYKLQADPLNATTEESEFEEAHAVH